MDRKSIRRYHVSRNSWAAQAERIVHKELDTLPMDRFIVAHDIKFKYGNIDHLVIRDDGQVYMIETKSDRGVITTDGHYVYVNGYPLTKNPICQINRNIRWIRSMMARRRRKAHWITALLVFPFADIRVRWPIKNVSIVRATKLLSWLSS